MLTSPSDYKYVTVAGVDVKGDILPARDVLNPGGWRAIRLEDLTALAEIITVMTGVEVSKNFSSFDGVFKRDKLTSLRCPLGHFDSELPLASRVSDHYVIDEAYSDLKYEPKSYWHSSLRVLDDFVRLAYYDVQRTRFIRSIGYNFECTGVRNSKGYNSEGVLVADTNEDFTSYSGFEYGKTRRFSQEFHSSSSCSSARIKLKFGDIDISDSAESIKLIVSYRCLNSFQNREKYYYKVVDIDSSGTLDASLFSDSAAREALSATGVSEQLGGRDSYTAFFVRVEGVYLTYVAGGRVGFRQLNWNWQPS